MKRNMKYIATLALCCAAAASNAALTTWTGANSGDWSDAGNWSGGVPSIENGGGGLGLNNRANTIAIDGGVATQPSSNIPTTFDGFNTPGFALTGGASLTLTPSRFRENGGSTGGTGNIAAVSGAGSHLTFNSSAADQGWVLNREVDGVEVWNVSNGGTMSLNGTGRVDMSFSNTRYTEINLDGGTFEIEGFQIYGTRGGRESFTSTLKNFISLDNGSLMDFSGFFEGNLYAGDNYTSEAVLNFDFADEASAVRFKAGSSQGIFGNAANIDSAFGTMFTTSVVGGTLQKTDLGGNIWEVSVIPEPATLGLVVAMGAGLIATRRIFMI